MLRKKKDHITIKVFGIIIAVIIILAIGMSALLKNNFKQAYINPNPSGTDGPEGFGKLTESKDKQYYYRIRLKDKSVMIVSYRGKKSKVMIPDKIDDHKVKIIGDGAYSTNSKIKHIIIKYDLESIGLATFSDNPKLKKISIYGNIKKLDENTFYGTKAKIETHKNNNIYQLAKKKGIKVKCIK